MKNILELQNITKSFGNNTVINNLKYNFQEKTIYALMGANGSGKTTLFNIISGLLDSDGGSVVFNSHRIDGFEAHEVAKLGISRTFQDLRLIPSLSVYENILLAFKNKPSEKLFNAFLPSRVMIHQDKIEAILEQTHLKNIKHSKAKDISYGQQKLLNLAVAIANDFELLLLDEPVAGVQPEYREEILRLIQNLNKTVIVIEHNPEFIEALTEHILFLDEGKIITEGDYAHIKANSQVQEAYL